MLQRLPYALRTVTRHALAVGSCLLPLTGQAAPQDDHPSLTPAFDANWLLRPEGNLMLGGAAGDVAILRPDLPLIERVALIPGDAREATLRLRLTAAPGEEPKELAGGKAADGDTVDLGEQPGLQNVQLNAGSRLLIAAWRQQFHFHGVARLQEVTITRVADGASVELPRFGDSASVKTPLGDFRLVGVTSRAKLPVIERLAEVVRGDKAGEWRVAEGRGVTLTSAADGLNLHSRGQNNFDAEWNWAPALVFEPSEAGEYRLSGRIVFRSGKASDPEDPQTMRWKALHQQATQEQAEGGATELRVHRLLRQANASRGLTPGEDYEAQPIATASLGELSDGPVEIELDGLGELTAEWSREPSRAHGLVLRVAAKNDRATAPRVELHTNGISGQLAVTAHPRHELFSNRPQPRDGVYAVARDGKLWYGDQRLRLWGVNGFPDIDRLVNMGFNSQRLFQPTPDQMYDAESAKRGDAKRYTQGDNSQWDRADKRLADLRAGGCFATLGSLQDLIPVQLVAVDGSFISGGDDWEAWKAAVAEMQFNKDTLARGPLFFDERLQKIKMQHAKNLLTHVNPYTGKTYAEEEAIVVYYVFNENGGAKNMLEGSYERWPDYFRQKFQQRWNQWLRERYTSDARLIEAWGEVDDGESLQDGMIELGPSFAKRSAYPEQRAADFVRFVLELVDALHHDFRSYCRSLAPEGVGVNVAPFIFDTQYRPNMAWNYAQSLGDVNAHGMYFWNLDTQLAQPPSAYVMDSHSVEGVATIIYETNAARPGKHRAEYPLKAAALATWQDWDGVFWHYWHSGGGENDVAYLASPLNAISTGHYWNGVHHQNDPVMCTTMAAAGRLFLEGRLPAAPNPDLVRVGGEALFSYDHHNGINQTQRTFTTGSLLRYEPEAKDGVTVNGEKPSPNRRVTSAVTMGDHIVWDWPNARMIIDTPTVKAYVGKVSGDYRFRDGIVLAEVSTPYVTFAMWSEDDKPFVGDDASSRVHIAAVADAKNTGFDFDWSVRGGPMEQARAIRDRGRAPVLVDPVHFTLAWPQQIDGQLQGIDFALREASTHTVAGTNMIKHEGETMFMYVLRIDGRGPAVDTPSTTTPIATGSEQAMPGAPQGQASANAGPWHPIPNVAWSQDYHEAHRTLREAMYVYTSVSKEDASDDPAKRIVVSDAEIASLWSAAADFEVVFKDDRMAEVVVTFKQPPPFADAVDDYTERFGPPAEQQIAAQYETSSARWRATADRPSILMTESQGILKIIVTSAVSGD